MQQRKITLQIAGESVVCNFETNYFFKFVRDVTGKDLLVDPIEGIDTTGGFELLSDLVYCGYLAEQARQRQEAKVGQDDFRHYFFSMTNAEYVAEMLKLMGAMFPKEETPGEANPPAGETPLAGETSAP